MCHLCPLPPFGYSFQDSEALLQLGHIVSFLATPPQLQLDLLLPTFSMDKLWNRLGASKCRLEESHPCKFCTTHNYRSNIDFLNDFSNNWHRKLWCTNRLKTMAWHCHKAQFINKWMLADALVRISTGGQLQLPQHGPATIAFHPH